MPLVQALKLLSLKATFKVSTDGEYLLLGLYDMPRAHVFGKAKRRTFIKRLEVEREEGNCGFLNRTAYGTRDASSTCQIIYTKLLERHGIVRGKTRPATFFSGKFAGIRALVHGNDIVVLASARGRKFSQSVLAERFQQKRIGLLGPNCEGKEFLLLCRVSRHVETTEGPARHVREEQHRLHPDGGDHDRAGGAQC